MEAEDRKWKGWDACRKIFVRSFRVDISDDRTKKYIASFLKRGKTRYFEIADFPRHFWENDSPIVNMGRIILSAMLHDAENGDTDAAAEIKAMYRIAYPKEYNTMKRLKVLDAETVFSLVGVDETSFRRPKLDRNHLPSITDTDPGLMPPEPEGVVGLDMRDCARVIMMNRVMGRELRYHDPDDVDSYDELAGIMETTIKELDRIDREQDQNEEIDLKGKKGEAVERMLDQMEHISKDRKKIEKMQDFVLTCCDRIGINGRNVFLQNTDAVMADETGNDIFVQTASEHPGRKYTDNELMLMANIVHLTAVLKLYYSYFPMKLTELFFTIAKEPGVKEAKKEEPEEKKPVPSESEEVAALKKELEELQKKYDADEQEIRHLTNALSDEKEKNRRAADEISAMLDAEEEADEAEESGGKEAAAAIDLEAVKDKKVLIVGGHEKWVAKMKSEYQNWQFALRNHENENDRFNVTGFDIVVINIDHLSHSDYYIFRNKLEAAEKCGNPVPVGYIRSTNIRQAGEAVYRIAAQAKGEENERIRGQGD